MSLLPMTSLPRRSARTNSPSTRRGRARLLWAAATLVVALCVATSAAASTVLKLDLESLVANSQQIIDGTVTRVDTKVEHGKVFTYTTIEVQDGLKGANAGDAVTVRQIGGRTDELATWVPGIPGFQAGERVIGFWRRPTPTPCRWSPACRRASSKSRWARTTSHHLSCPSWGIWRCWNRAHRARRRQHPTQRPSPRAPRRGRRFSQPNPIRSTGAWSR